MIYLVAIREHGLCKIGLANDPARRVALLQTASPFALELVATIPGGRSAEARLHSAFRPLRVRGEWFEFTDAIAVAFANPDAPLPQPDCPVAEIFHALGGATAIARGTGHPVQTVHDWLAKGSAEIPPWRRDDVLNFARRAKKADDLSDEALAYLASDKRSVRKAAA
jgi:hypothetical protein